MAESKSLYEIVNNFYTKAVQHERGKALLAIAKSDLGQCVYNIYIGDDLVVNFVFKDGEFTIKQGRGEPAAGAMFIEAEVSEDVLTEIMEGRQGFTEATANTKIFMRTVGVIWDFKTRPFMSVWGSLTKIGQDIVVAEKVKVCNLAQ